METRAQLKAIVPQALKRQAFSLLALRGQGFSSWVRGHLETLVQSQDTFKGGERMIELPLGDQTFIQIEPEARAAGSVWLGIGIAGGDQAPKVWLSPVQVEGLILALRTTAAAAAPEDL